MLLVCPCVQRPKHLNRRYPIAELLATGGEWSSASDWPVTYEYVLIGNVTCTADAAFELVQLLRFRRCKLNLIPLNAANDIPLRSPTASEIADFETVVRDAGLQVFTRKPKGRDILAACGQLARKVGAPRPHVGSFPYLPMAVLPIRSRKNRLKSTGP